MFHRSCTRFRPQVVLKSSPNCPLCDKLFFQLKRLQAAQRCKSPDTEAFDLSRTILQNTTDKGFYEVPIIEIDGREIFNQAEDETVDMREIRMLIQKSAGQDDATQTGTESKPSESINEIQGKKVLQEGS